MDSVYKKLFTLFNGNHFDNFQQYWKEQNDDELHKDKSGQKHQHIHVKCSVHKDSKNKLQFDFYTGRNNTQKLHTVVMFITQNGVELNGQNKQITFTEHGFEFSDGSLIMEHNIMHLKGFGINSAPTNTPYVLQKCRYFSGWIQYPPELKDPDTLYSLRDLEMHDQGGMVALDVEGIDYTAELTQLVYAHSIEIMKLAIYDLPMKEVDINSKAIAYTWCNPDATRIGINIRKAISGWTLIEPNYKNSNNLNKK